MKPILIIVALASVLLTGCAKLSSLGDPWTYSEETDKITNDTVVKAIALLKDEKQKIPVKIQVEFRCAKSKGTDGLTVEVATYNAQDQPEPMTGLIGVRLNGAALSGLAREGTNYNNSSKWQVELLQFVSVFERYKDSDETLRITNGFGNMMSAFTGGLVAMPLSQKVAGVATAVKLGTSPALTAAAFHIWDTSVAVTAETASGSPQISFDLSHKSIKKVFESCGFIFAQPLPVAAKEAAPEKPAPGDEAAAAKPNPAAKDESEADPDAGNTDNDPKPTAVPDGPKQ